MKSAEPTQDRTGAPCLARRTDFQYHIIWPSWAPNRGVFDLGPASEEGSRRRGRARGKGAVTDLEVRARDGIDGREAIHARSSRRAVICYPSGSILRHRRVVYYLSAPSPNACKVSQSKKGMSGPANSTWMSYPNGTYIGTSADSPFP